jgi:hypothetical protein
LPDTAEFIEPPMAAIEDDPVREEIFVRAIDLPTLSVKQARAAVAQQIDILSPLPPAGVVSSVVLLGPVEEGLNRFAVGFAPRELLDRAAEEGQRVVTLTGRLEGETIVFRFERPGIAPGEVDWARRLELATIAAMCLAIVMAAFSLRLDHELDGVQARLDTVNTEVRGLGGETAALARVGRAWRAAQAIRKPGLIDCALGNIAKASGGPVALSSFSLANGQFNARLSQPASDATVTALRALGFSVSGPTPAAPADAAAPAAAIRDVQTSSVACR